MRQNKELSSDILSTWLKVYRYTTKGRSLIKMYLSLQGKDFFVLKQPLPLSFEKRSIVNTLSIVVFCFKMPAESQACSHFLKSQPQQP